MMRSRLLTIVALVGLAAPVAGIAQSYMTPEEVLQQNNGAFLVPGHSRGAQWAADQQAQQYNERHPSIVTDPGDPVQDNGIPPPDFAIWDDGQSDQPVMQNQYGNLDPTTARLLARLAQQNSILASTMSGQGAPLAQTGPAAILVVIAMMIATGVTLMRARILERFVRES